MLGEAGEAEPDGGLQIEAVDGLGNVAGDLGEQRGAGDEAVLLALGDAQVGENHQRILLQGEGYGIVEGELERGLGAGTCEGPGAGGRGRGRELAILGERVSG